MEVIRADFHVHAIGDGYGFNESTKNLVQRMILAAARKGLQCLGITDHDTCVPALYAREFIKQEGIPLLILIGREVTAVNSHVLAINTTEEIPRGKSFKETVELIHEAGGMAILPHPHLRSWINGQGFDGFEWFNGFHGAFEYADVLLPRFGGSDSHTSLEMEQTCVHTLVQVEEFSEEAVVRALKNGLVEPAKFEIDKITKFG